MVVTDGTHVVTGVLTPDATGKFLQTGLQGGQPYYRREDGAFFIWWDGALFWYITPMLAVVGANGWNKAGGAAAGDYNPYGANVGVATVTEI